MSGTRTLDNTLNNRCNNNLLNSLLSKNNKKKILMANIQLAKILMVRNNSFLIRRLVSLQLSLLLLLKNPVKKMKVVSLSSRRSVVTQLMQDSVLLSLGQDKLLSLTNTTPLTRLSLTRDSSLSTAMDTLSDLDRMFTSTQKEMQSTMPLLLESFLRHLPTHRHSLEVVKLSIEDAKTKTRKAVTTMMSQL